MAETRYIPHNDCNGTSNVTGLLFPHQLQAIRMIVPRDMERVFGPGIDIDLPLAMRTQRAHQSLR